MLWSYPQDHPRLCGEKWIFSLWTNTAPGSPPPMRGKGRKNTDAVRPYRITPAYAGKRWEMYGDTTPVQDHPRLCGEKDLLKKIGLIEIGSPPPMRGKAALLLRWSGGVWDHPRLCGEKGFQEKPNLEAEGSPPPMRGKVPYTITSTGSIRITPAYAGKSRKCVCYR